MVKATDNKAKNQVVIYLRVDKRKQLRDRWNHMLKELFLDVQREKIAKACSIDVSQAYFMDSGVVKYLWRLVVQGDMAIANRSISFACTRALSATSPEVTSFPLVGRLTYPFNPAMGQIKGAYSLDDNAKAQQMAVALMQRPGMMQ